MAFSVRAASRDDAHGLNALIERSARQLSAGEVTWYRSDAQVLHDRGSAGRRMVYGPVGSRYDQAMAACADTLGSRLLRAVVVPFLGCFAFLTLWAMLLWASLPMALLVSTS